MTNALLGTACCYTSDSLPTVMLVVTLSTFEVVLRLAHIHPVAGECEGIQLVVRGDVWKHLTFYGRGFHLQYTHNVADMQMSNRRGVHNLWQHCCPPMAGWLVSKGAGACVPVWLKDLHPPQCGSAQAVR